MNQRRSKTSLGKTLVSVAIAMLLVLSSIAPAVASISPAALEATLAPGASIHETKTITIPALPSRADVVFAFDLTGSMGGIIGTAKSKSIEIMNRLATTGVDINYGVMSYMDYPHVYSSYGYSAEYGSSSSYCGDYAYRLNRAITSDRTAVSSAINGLRIGCGSDGPQDYTRIMYESYADPSVAWRSGAKKVLVNFGDNVPHDNNLNEGVPGKSGTWSTGGDPGRDEVILNADDLNLQTVLAQMRTNNVILLESHTYPYAKEYWDYWTGITGGKTYVTTSGTLVDDLVREITSALTSPTVTNLHLKASSGYESWVSAPDSYTGPTGVTISQGLTITVPAVTADGTYTFTVSAVDNAGVSYGDQAVTIHVVGNKPPVAKPGGPYVGNEGSAITFDGSASYDPDAGDSIVKYEWDLNNDGIFESEGVTVSNTWSDDYSGTVNLRVTDTHGASHTASTTVTVNNVAPTVTLDKSYYATVPITLRIAGQGKVGNSVVIEIIQDGGVIATSNKIVRTPGSPNEQEATVVATLDLSKPYSGRLIFDTEAAISGGTPVWVVIDGNMTKVTTFNTQKNNPASYHQTYDFTLAGLFSLAGKELTFKATASDPGTDGMTFGWDFGDGSVLSNPYAWSGSHTVTDTVTHTYTAAGSYTVNLKVTDDDGGVGSVSETINIP